MAKDVTFQLDKSGGADILQNMAMPLVRSSAQSISSRANSMAASMTSRPPTFKMESSVGIIKRGQRAIATVSSSAIDSRQSYIAYEALRKSKDGGRVS